MKNNKAYDQEVSGNLSELHTWNKSFFIFVVLFVSSMSFPFRYPSFGLIPFTNVFLDANYRHYMFLFCNGILLFLFLKSGSKHTSEAAHSQEYQELGPEVTQIESDEISFGGGLEKMTHDQTEGMETTERVIHICREHENETNVIQINADVDDHECHIEDDQETEVTHNDQTDQDMETEQVIHICRKHENETNVTQIVVDDRENHVEYDQETEVEEDDDEEEEEGHEFRQKCEAFIKKVKQSMHHEGPPMIDSHDYADD